jgi:hypothetical protein
MMDSVLAETRRSLGADPKSPPTRMVLMDERVISTTALAACIEEPITKLTTWTHRGFIEPDTGRGWTVLGALAVGCFAMMLRNNRSVSDASAEAKGLTEIYGQFLNAAFAEVPPPKWAKADALIAVVARFGDGSEERHFILRKDELGDLLVDLMFKRHAGHVEVHDLLQIFIRVTGFFSRRGRADQ